MGKQVDAQTNVEQARIMQERLEQQGIDSKVIEDWIQQPGRIDAILADNKLLLQYFMAAVRGLNEITSWEFDDPFQSLPAQIPAPEKYGDYYDTSGEAQAVQGRDYLQEALLFDPQKLQEQGYMTSEQAQAFAKLMEDGLFAKQYSDQNPPTTKSAPTDPSSPPPTSQDSVPSSPQAPSGSESSQASATGGTSKAYGSSGSSTSAPPPPPPPPPPSTGMAPTAGTPSGQYVDPWVGDYINTVGNAPVQGMLHDLLGDMNMSNGVIYHLIQDMESDRATMHRIRGMLEGLDPNDPKDRHKIAVLQQEMAMLGDSMKQKYDKLQTARRFVTERMGITKGLMDLAKRADETIMRNMRIS